MRAPTYQSQTNAPSGSQTRLVAPDTTGIGAGIARGLQSAARGMGQYAEAEFAIQEKHNDINARKLALEWRTEVQPLLLQYKSLKGQDAGMQAAAMREQIAKLRDQYADRAGNDRMREAFSLKTDEALASYDGQIVEHSVGQMWQYEWDVNVADLSNEQAMMASDPFNPQVRDDAMRSILSIASSLSDMAGERDPELRENRLRKAHDAAVLPTVTAMLSDPSAAARMDEIIEYAEESMDLLSTEGMNKLKEAIAEPKLNRALDDELDSLFSGAASPSAEADAGGGVASSASASAAPRQIPAAGPVTDDFGEHRARGSAGLDIAAARGSAIKPVADGVVEEAGTGKTGGNFIRIRHADGTLTSYMHMGQPPAYKKGDRVTQSTVIGTVGSTGRASGPHLHLEVKDAQGRQIDPEEYLKGSTPVGSPAEPRIWDTAAVLEAIKAKEDDGTYTPEQADQLRARFARRVNRDEAIINQRDADAVRAAQEWMLVPGNLDNFTSYEQLPANVRAGFKPETALRFTEVARQGANAQASANAAALADMQDLEYNRLTGMKALDEDAFMALDLTQYAGRIKSDQFATLAQAQATMRQKRDDGELNFLPGATIKSTISSMAAMDGEKFKEGSDQFNAIATIMEDRANAFIRDNKGKLPGPADFQDFYRYATAKVPAKYSRGISNLFMGSEGEAPRYEIEGSVEGARTRNEQTTQERAQRRQRNQMISGIRSEFVRINGRYPTPEELARRLAILEGE